MKTKQVNYFYPTSPTAEYTGFESGGFSVEVGEIGKIPKAVAYFRLVGEAVEYAKALPFDWDRNFKSWADKGKIDWLHGLTLD